MGKLIDLTGRRFGRLVVIERKENDKNNKARWLCKCDCGKNLIVLSNALRSGNTSSCGCARILHMKLSNTVHGHHGTRLYRIWANMKQRTSNPENPDYKYYGGKGVCVCEQWENFENFEKWALNSGYADTLTIDRIDNNGNYSPENCRWVSLKQQCNNRCTNINIEFDGRIMTLQEWAEFIGVHRNTLVARLFRYGWSIEKALTARPKKRKRKEKSQPP